jgi:hypothetical protein
MKEMSARKKSQVDAAATGLERKTFLFIARTVLCVCLECNLIYARSFQFTVKHNEKRERERGRESEKITNPSVLKWIYCGAKGY